MVKCLIKKFPNKYFDMRQRKLRTLKKRAPARFSDYRLYIY